jgi:hypothetical protein
MRSLRFFAIAALLAGVIAGSTDAEAFIQGPRVRHSSSNFMTSGSSISSSWVYANPGERLVALTSGSTNLDADVQLIRWNNGSPVTVRGSYSTSSTEKIDYINEYGYEYFYVRVYQYSGSGNVLWTFDTSSYTSSKLDTCFGGVGDNCNGAKWWVFDFSPCNWGANDGSTTCWQAIGSQKHDTCCSANPLGHYCNNGVNESDTVCRGEWDRAYWDTYDGFKWGRWYNPTHIAYQPSDRVDQSNGSWEWGWPDYADGQYAPSGVTIKENDFNKGWCASNCALTNWWDDRAQCVEASQCGCSGSRC